MEFTKKDSLIMNKKISIICCCYNEEDNIIKAYESFIWLINQCPQYDYEILFEDNCSIDRTQELIREIVGKDNRVKAIFNQGNFGIERSSANALSAATGDAVIVVPCDLQEPVDILPDFLKYWEDGYDVVWGQKVQSEERKIKFYLRSLFYNIIDFFSEYKQFHHVIGFGVTDRKVIDALNIVKLQDPSVEIRNFVAEYQFKTKLIPYKQHARLVGKTSYNLGRMLDFSITTLCNISTKPLRLITILGGIAGVTCVLAWIVCLVYKLVYWDNCSIGVVVLVIGIFFAMSIQLFCIGILGEYIRCILRKVDSKPVVIEKERLNFDSNESRINVCEQE